MRLYTAKLASGRGQTIEFAAEDAEDARAFASSVLHAAPETLRVALLET